MSSANIEAAAAALWRETLDLSEADFVQWSTHTDEQAKRHYRRAAQAVIDVLRPTITTVEQLDALPVGSVVLAGGVLVQSFARYGTQAPAWVGIGDPYRYVSDEFTLPATVLWHSGWAVTE